MEVVTSKDPSSTWEVTSPVVPIAVIVGTSSLSKFRVISVVLLVALVIVPNVKTIGSKISTSSSSKASVVEAVILPVNWPAGITISEDNTSTAVAALSESVNGMVTSTPLTADKVAVKVTSSYGNSWMVGDENAYVTSDNSSLSVSSKSKGLATPSVSKASKIDAFIGVPGCTISDSVSSYKVSSSPVMVNVPEVSPALIFSCGDIW